MGYPFYRRDNKSYSLIIEDYFSAEKIVITLLKRNEKESRIDLGLFYMNYRKFRALLKIMQMAWLKHGKNAKVNEVFYGGTDGKRSINISLEGGDVKFFVTDKIIIETQKTYTGKVAFRVSETIDIMEFFGLIDTINNWEISTIRGMIKDYDSNKTESKK